MSPFNVLNHELAEDGMDGRWKTWDGSLKEFTGHIFNRFAGIVFISAVGIAVRVLAPYIDNKYTDPAVVVVDDAGTFAVSLLGGHRAGANGLAGEIAAALQGTAVVTTSTDRHNLVAFDLLAYNSGWIMERDADLKKISAAQIRGERLVVVADEGISVSLPGNIMSFVREHNRENEEVEKLLSGYAPAPAGIIFISSRRDLPEPPPGMPHIILRPRCLVVGAGCRKGVPAENVTGAVYQALKECGRVAASLSKMVTIDFKGGEEGLQKGAEQLGIPLETRTVDEIGDVLSNFSNFKESEFVRSRTGVGAVSGPCAYLGSGQGKLILEKIKYRGVTVSLAESKLVPVDLL